MGNCTSMFWQIHHLVENKMVDLILQFVAHISVAVSIHWQSPSTVLLLSAGVQWMETATLM
jgi:hypothetical protein